MLESSSLSISNSTVATQNEKSIYNIANLYIVNNKHFSSLSGGCVDPEEMLEATGEHVVLKKVLNIVFLTIGSLLFISVFVVIIYTSIVGE